MVELTAEQREFVESSERLKMFVAGRGGGKTTALKAVLENYIGKCRGGERIVFVGFLPVFDAMSDIVASAETTPASSGRTFYWDPPTIEFSTHEGRIASFRATDIDLLLVDNVERMSEENFKLLVSRCRNANSQIAYTFDPEQFWMVRAAGSVHRGGTGLHPASVLN